jgi:hypothetical protein
MILDIANVLPPAWGSWDSWQQQFVKELFDPTLPIWGSHIVARVCLETTTNLY